jgi:hypothetical protein
MNCKTDSGSQIVADYPKYKDESNKDKQIRAIFIRLFSELFAGYRSCLLIIRINPKPVISFHKVIFVSFEIKYFCSFQASFLGHHRLVNDEFMLRVLDSMSFHKFTEERGPPFRSCDIFDDVYALIHDQLKRENDPMNYSTAVFEHIKELANQLLLSVKKTILLLIVFGKYFSSRKIRRHNKRIHKKSHNQRKRVVYEIIYRNFHIWIKI